MRKLTMLLFSLLAFVGVVRAQVETILPEGVEESAFGNNAVTDGTNFYATLQAAVEAVAGQANSTLYCKPGADVGSLQHAPVVSTLTIYGNDANVTGGSERDFDLGNTDPSAGKDITADMTLTVKHLNGCGAWGAKATEHTVNLVFENCANMGKVYISGTTGTLNITMNDCAFEGVLPEAVYSNADGAITLNNVEFSNLNKAVNLNRKAAGTQTVTINGCSFTNCGADVAADQIPVRVLSSVDGGKTVLNVSNATFTGTPEGGADILLDYGVGETTASVTATAANVFVEKESNVATKTTVTESEGGEFTNVVPVAKVNGIEYMTLDEAITAAQNGETIILNADVKLTAQVEIPAGKVLTLDLNGKTVTVPEEAKHIYALNNKGTLTIKDSNGNGSISARGIYNGYDGVSSNNTVEGAKLIIESGKFIALDSDGGAAILNCAELVINDGTFKGIVAAVNNRAKGVATINGGTFAGGYDGGKSTNYIIQNNGGSLTINDANVVSGFGAVGCYSGETIINGGSFLPTGWEGYTCHVVYVAGAADVTINGGTFKMNYPADATPDSGSAVASYYNGKLSITGGSFTAHFDNVSPVELSDGSVITGGSYYNHSGVASTHSWVTNFIKDGYELGANGTVAAKPVAEVNGVKYATFAEAVAAAHKATDKVTITLKKDITVSAAISINKLVTIDLNGKAISSAEGYVFEVTGGELVLQGEGSIGAICYIINDADYKAADKTFALTENKNNVDIVYNRTFGHTSWQVLYVPFAIPVENMEGFEVYSISNVTDSGVVIEQVVEGDLSANTPYIIKATEAGDKTIKVTGATLSVPVACEETIGNFTINGTYSSMAIDAESQYVLTNGLWCQLTEKAVTDGNNILGAFRVYLTANGENTPSEVRFVINNSDATAIDELKAENGNVKAEVYDLSGRRVEKAVRGIYVVNGVKVIK